MIYDADCYFLDDDDNNNDHYYHINIKDDDISMHIHHHLIFIILKLPLFYYYLGFLLSSPVLNPWTGCTAMHSPNQQQLKINNPQLRTSFRYWPAIIIDYFCAATLKLFYQKILQIQITTHTTKFITTVKNCSAFHNTSNTILVVHNAEIYHRIEPPCYINWDLHV